MTKVNVVYLRGQALVRVSGRGEFTLEVEPQDAWKVPDLVRGYFLRNDLGPVDVDYTGTAGKVGKGNQ
jgi:hypothetical protein